MDQQMGHLQHHLGRYKIESLLGGGAYAEVYLATDAVLNRKVALKVLKPALLADEEAFARFVQEAQSAASLFHPSIATVLDLGEADGRYFMAMRYVDGASLDKVIARQGTLPWAQIVRIVEQIASALDFAHARGLVHRDVKPQNILISQEEGAVLTDFGLVRALESSGVGTRTGAILGTPQYIPPEVWKGKPVTPSADQYALACVLVEMLSGRALFDGPTPWAIMAAHASPPELPPSFLGGAPAGLEGALKKALAQEPAERFATCGELIAALRPAAQIEAVEQAGIAAPVQVESARSPVVEIQKNEMTITLAPGVEMVFVRVPAGEFWMGSDEEDAEAFDDEKPLHQVYLDEYWIGKYPVTNQQFQLFVQKSGQPKGWNFERGQEQHPAVNLNWHDAIAFLSMGEPGQRAAVRLPTKAEWEKAARGTDKRSYPWGDQPPDKNLGQHQ